VIQNKCTGNFGKEIPSKEVVRKGGKWKRLKFLISDEICSCVLLPGIRLPNDQMRLRELEQPVTV
jgi:hypothetical protein